MKYGTRHLRRLAAGLLVALLLPISAAWAHEVRPAYLEIKETGPSQFSVLWRTPLLSGMRLPVVLQLPAGVKNVKEPMIDELTDSVTSAAGLRSDLMDWQEGTLSSLGYRARSPTCWFVSSGLTVPLR